MLHSVGIVCHFNIFKLMKYPISRRACVVISYIIIKMFVCLTYYYCLRVSLTKGMTCFSSTFWPRVAFFSLIDRRSVLEKRHLGWPRLPPLSGFEASSTSNFMSYILPHTRMLTSCNILLSPSIFKLRSETANKKCKKELLRLAGRE
jgi:hypothetical protein